MARDILVNGELEVLVERQGLGYDVLQWNKEDFARTLAARVAEAIVNQQDLLIPVLENRAFVDAVVAHLFGTGKVIRYNHAVSSRTQVEEAVRMNLPGAAGNPSAVQFHAMIIAHALEINHNLFSIKTISDPRIREVTIADENAVKRSIIQSTLAAALREVKLVQAKGKEWGFHPAVAADQIYYVMRALRHAITEAASLTEDLERVETILRRYHADEPLSAHLLSSVGLQALSKNMTLMDMCRTSSVAYIQNDYMDDRAISTILSWLRTQDVLTVVPLIELKQWYDIYHAHPVAFPGHRYATAVYRSYPEKVAVHMLVARHFTVDAGGNFMRVENVKRHSDELTDLGTVMEPTLRGDNLVATVMQQVTGAPTAQVFHSVISPTEMRLLALAHSKSFRIEWDDVTSRWITMHYVHLEGLNLANAITYGQVLNEMLITPSAITTLRFAPETIGGRKYPLRTQSPEASLGDLMINASQLLRPFAQDLAPMRLRAEDPIVIGQRVTGNVLLADAMRVRDRATPTSVFRNPVMEQFARDGFHALRFALFLSGDGPQLWDRVSMALTRSQLDAMRKPLAQGMIQESALRLGVSYLPFSRQAALFRTTLAISLYRNLLNKIFGVPADEVFALADEVSPAGIGLMDLAEAAPR